MNKQVFNNHFAQAETLFWTRNTAGAETHDTPQARGVLGKTLSF